MILVAAIGLNILILEAAVASSKLVLPDLVVLVGTMVHLVVGLDSGTRPVVGLGTRPVVAFVVDIETKVAFVVGVTLVVEKWVVVEPLTRKVAKPVVVEVPSSDEAAAVEEMASSR